MLVKYSTGAFICRFIGVYIYIYYFFRRSTARTTHPILTHDGSNDVVGYKKYLLGVRMMTFHLLGVCSPQNRKHFGVGREIPVKTGLLNNFLTVRNTLIIIHQ